ncbi:MAG: MFS transporter, partial [Rhodospirillales bacterium]|nr:MFS transporter [Rhodospirillales bacterium]
RMITRSADGRSTEIKAALNWVYGLAGVTSLIALMINAGIDPTWTLVGGLAVFGFLFAVNSSLHSYLILAFADRNDVALDVGFYYMANAAGRLGGTLLSGWAYQIAGMAGCLGAATVMLILAGVITMIIPRA